MSSDSNRSRRRDVLKGIGAAGGFALAGCAGGGGGDGRTIRLGILMGVSGGLAELGPAIRQSSELVGTYVNENSDQFEVDVQFEDTGTDPNQGISGAQALVNAGYPMYSGALSSTVSLQVANQVAIPEGIVGCSPASTSPAITGLEDDDYIWRTTPTDALQSQVMAQVASDRLGHSNTSILALNNDYGQGLADAYAQSWEDLGNTVDSRVDFEPGQSSYSSQLSEVLDNQPDILMIVGYPDSGVQIFRDFYSDYSQDFCDIIVPDGLQSESLPGNVGNSMRNVWGTVPLSEGPGLDFFQEQYRNEYDGLPQQGFLPQSWDSAAVLCLANAAAGENSGAAVRDEMANVANEGGTEITPDNLIEGLEMAANGEEINYQGASGVIEFSDAGDIATASYQLFRYQEGGLENVDTVSP